MTGFDGASQVAVADAPRKLGGTEQGWLRRYRVALILAGLFVVFGAVAAGTFPRPAPVYRPDSFGVAITVNSTFKAAVVRVLPPVAGRVELSVLIITGPPPGTQGSEEGIIQLTLPPGTKAIGCHRVPRAILGEECFPPSGGAVNGGTTLDLTTHAFGPVRDSPGFWSAPIDVTLIASHFAFDSNGLDAEAVLPQITVASSAPKPYALPGSLSIYYWVADASSYDWSGQPLPNLAKSRFIEWIENISTSNGQISSSYGQITSTNGPVAISGIDNAAQERANLLAFVAGACIGIAGGALIGAIQEALHAPRRAAKRPGPSSPPPPPMPA